MSTPEDRLRSAADVPQVRPGVNPIVWGYVLVAVGSGIWAFALGFMAGYLVGRG